MLPNARAGQASEESATAQAEMEQLIQAGKLVATLSEKFKKDAKWTLAAARAITQITTAERSVIFASSEGRQLELLNELANSKPFATVPCGALRGDADYSALVHMP